jgi:hypothetical protein
LLVVGLLAADEPVERAVLDAEQPGAEAHLVRLVVLPVVEGADEGLADEFFGRQGALAQFTLVDARGDLAPGSVHQSVMVRFERFLERIAVAVEGSVPEVGRRGGGKGVVCHRAGAVRWAKERRVAGFIK